MFEKCHGRQFVIALIGTNEPENGVSGRKRKHKKTPQTHIHPPAISAKKMLQHGPLAPGTQTEFRQRWPLRHQPFSSEVNVRVARCKKTTGGVTKNVGANAEKGRTKEKAKDLLQTTEVREIPK